MQHVLSLRKVLLVAVALLTAAFAGLPAAQAAPVVTVINETGYALDTVKYVREDGAVKRVVGQTSLANGGSHTFSLPSAGSYRVYASLRMDGQLRYAKGNAYTLKDSSRARLTLKKVVSSSSSSISFINEDEFDRIK